MRMARSGSAAQADACGGCLRSRRELPRRYPEGALEALGQVALVGEADGGGDRGWRVAGGELALRLAQAQLQLIGVGRQAVGPREGAAEMEAAHAGDVREVGGGDVVGQCFMQEIAGAAQGEEVRAARCVGRDETRIGVAGGEAQAGVAQQRLAFERRRAFAQRLVQRLHAARQDGIADQGRARERQLGRPAVARVHEHAAHGFRRQIEHAVGEALGDAGMAVMGLVRVEGHDHAGRAGMQRAAAMEGLHARLRHADGIALVAVALVDMALEMGVQQLDPERAGGGVVRPVAVPQPPRHRGRPSGATRYNNSPRVDHTIITLGFPVCDPPSPSFGCHPRESGGPGQATSLYPWTPAFAGVTGVEWAGDRESRRHCGCKRRKAMLTTPENAGDLDHSGDDAAGGGSVRFNTKIAVVLREDLAVWQKLNMTAFLVSGVAGTDADTIGEPYEDASGHRYLPMFRQPVLVFAGSAEQLRRAYDRLRAGGLRFAVFTDDLFATGNDGDNRAAVKAVRSEDLRLAGMAVRGERKAIDKALKGLSLHR